MAVGLERTAEEAEGGRQEERCFLVARSHRAKQYVGPLGMLCPHAVVLEPGGTTLGRGVGSGQGAVQLPHQWLTVSHRHCSLRALPSGEAGRLSDRAAWTLTDHSKFGTAINGTLCPREGDVMLHDGDVICLCPHASSTEAIEFVFVRGRRALPAAAELADRLASQRNAELAAIDTYLEKESAKKSVGSSPASARSGGDTRSWRSDVNSRPGSSADSAAPDLLTSHASLQDALDGLRFSQGAAALLRNQYNWTAGVLKTALQETAALRSELHLASMHVERQAKQLTALQDELARAQGENDSLRSQRKALLLANRGLKRLV